MTKLVLESENPSKDIEAIGRSRAGRNLSTNMKAWMYVNLVVCMVGLYFMFVVSTMIGLAIAIAGCASLFMYSNKVDKIRKIMVKRLKREYREELDRVRE
ncbi:MAG: hypothetical protein PHQ86_06550 [Dehalococcoidales bacterium]|jgi:hypothetical protein|nr:hypothetical protein [Dehalococcoidales bacterium]